MFSGVLKNILLMIVLTITNIQVALCQVNSLERMMMNRIPQRILDKLPSREAVSRTMLMKGLFVSKAEKSVDREWKDSKGYNSGFQQKL